MPVVCASYLPYPLGRFIKYLIRLLHLKNYAESVGDKSIVARAQSKSPSLRTTIPKSIVDELSIHQGDVLDWEITTEKGRRIMKVKKLE